MLINGFSNNVTNEIKNLLEIVFFELKILMNTTDNPMRVITIPKVNILLFFT